VHLFEWRWNDIATECETVLGPAGFKAVQVSPPNEHSLTPSRDWSERYQPVSHSLARSRSGTGTEFQAMVDRCAAVGVGIYVDAVINHMTNFPSPGTGSNGTAYTKYDYPGLWTAADFHAPCAVNDFASAANVQDCELFTLPDLDTGSATVRQKLADYLIAVARLGVAGFRIDAAKHIQQVELDDIIDRMNTTLVGEGRPIPYVFLEISGGSGEALDEDDFYGVGFSTGGATDITEFTVTGLADKFRKVGGQSISQLDPNGPSGAQFSQQAWGIMPSDKAVIFLQNHDTQHNCGISPADGDAYRLAHVFMLAQPYGYPSVLSSYRFTCPSGNSAGPRSDPDGWTLPVACAASWEAATSNGDWICEHRDPHIAQMVGFRRRVAGTAITGWWDNDANAIAFSRGDRGFVAINRESASVNVTATTTLAPGTYCDLITGGKVGDACAGTSIIVAAGGAVQFPLASNRAVAIDVSGKL
jgi:alpha-amylase